MRDTRSESVGEIDELVRLHDRERFGEGGGLVRGTRDD
jgi:hypothetical protein